MTYKLSPDVAKIRSPITLVVDGVQSFYANGEALASAIFEKYYLISSLEAKDNVVVLHLEENKRINEITWVGEEAVTFF